MDTDLNSIHVFKTNIGKIDPDCTMQQTLDSNTAIQQWNIDHEDVDCVLRIVSETLKPKAIINLINEFGYECHELP
ncbi:hypothetical protein GKZ90_0014950 [Flavobacterium sp. MC2016-06]|jgi:hypothetical protein|uniref:hypothetical protein n=1 Tax=Flavobacterium sp. MC2016-06 TaxID=2676308 RepID=UPI0012BA86E6|nr:hypothetical protein [Flavobacterium sp. MC2016-06]MBU3862198.1 hypothetical protein [Flavobacterium sp. MC2016-06]